MPNEIELIEQEHKNDLNEKESTWLKVIGCATLIAFVFIIF